MKSILILITILLVGCGPSAEQKQQGIQKFLKNKNSIIIPSNTMMDNYCALLTVEIIDSCEYIILTGYAKCSIIHKANCKNH